MKSQFTAKLRPRARIIRTIGDQLISGPEAAIIELVKNAYDADASKVELSIRPRNAVDSLGEILITDTGHGMTPEIILNRWFEPATDDKLKRVSSPGGRTLLGAKGIGRFAAARLGLMTSLISVAEADDGGQVKSTLSVDWRQFEEDTYLDQVEIPISIEELSFGKALQTGTRLQISELRDTWTRKRIESLVRELRRVALPAAENERPFIIQLDLSAFNSGTSSFDGNALLKDLNKDVSSAVSENDDFRIIRPFRVNEHADYKLAGRFNQHGDFQGIFQIVRGDKSEQSLVIPAPPWTPDDTSCGEVAIELNIYDREPEAIAELFHRMGLQFNEIGIRAARKILTDASGISIFRSGFRIRPYGDPENDWLELERQRVQNPSKKLGLSQISGKLLIGSPSKSGLVERSSREGLEHNGSFERLRSLVSNLLIHIEDRRLSFREKAGLSRRLSADVDTAKALATLPTITKAIDKTPEPHRAPLRRAAELDSIAIAASLEEIDAYQKLLQSRAALGLVVAQIIHEGRRLLNPMSSSAKSINESATILLDESKLGQVARKQLPSQIAIIIDSSRQLSRLFKRLDPLSSRRRGRPCSFDLGELVQSSLALFSDAIRSSNITVSVNMDAGMSAYGYPEDFQASLMNILENAIYWLGASSKASRSLDVDIQNSSEMTHTFVSNNGPAIDEANATRLFHAGFSLRSEGTGLGLAIARQACHASNGEIRYLEDEDKTTFVIDFPIKKRN